MNDDMIKIPQDPETRALVFELIEAEREVRRIKLRLDGQSRIQSIISAAVENPDEGIGPLKIEKSGRVVVWSGCMEAGSPLPITSKKDLVDIITYTNDDECTWQFDESVPDFINALAGWIGQELHGGYVLTEEDYEYLELV